MDRETPYDLFIKFSPKRFLAPDLSIEADELRGQERGAVGILRNQGAGT